MTTHGKKVLIVEDEPDVVAYLAMLLEDCGFQTISAANGRDGIEAVRGEKPDLVTLDITMPESSGTRFYREIKSDPSTAGIPVIIITAITGPRGEPDAYKTFISNRKRVPPPEGFFSKPIVKADFIRRVRELLDDDAAR